MLFFCSLFSKETVIQKIARVMDGELNETALKYTRNLTYIWAIFLFINFLVSLATVFMAERIWIVYNGFISYMLIGMFFMIEYPIRMNFKRKHDV